MKEAKEMHEAKLLAVGGFEGSRYASMKRRYERAEKELFDCIEGVGRGIENRVTGNDSSQPGDQALTAETASAASYGSAEHHAKFEEF